MGKSSEFSYGWVVVGVGALMTCVAFGSMLSLAVFRIPTGVRAFIEDVVVDGRVRGQGVGAALTKRALELAVSRGARTVELTSRPHRVAANALYRKLGFEPRDTNVYRYTPR